ncbi:flagellar basal body-associated protein FliL [Thalassobacillus sp. C254]|uniref:flagellar basal body-associated protein FliL n=1 Tax=Thalassobacillus sp. C254 TaxID=1225341 RepID=UPI0006D0F8E4|nr:flagellar basal body-associated protein FliL [Thalassobacillus sp. C254]
MKKNKLLSIMAVMLVSITLLGVLAIVLFNYLSDDQEVTAEPSIEEVIENSWETEEITTNLSSNHFIRAQFRIHLDAKHTREEIKQRDFQVNNLIIRELANLKASDLQSKEGIEELEASLVEQLNEMVEDGKVVNVYTTQRMIQ